jgi:signal transduction histidine kinase
VKSIYAYTLLLLVVVLLVAQGIELLLPPARFEPQSTTISLNDIARSLGRDDGEPFGPPPDGNDLPGRPPHSPDGPPPGPPPSRDAGPPSRRLESHLLNERPALPTAGLVAADSFAALLAERLGKDAGQVVVYATSSDIRNTQSALEPSLAGAFIASMNTGDGHWRTVQRVPTTVPALVQHRWLIAIALELLVLLPLSWMFARTVASPVKRFAEAARRMGQETGGAPLEREGPAEIRQAVDAFNAMQGRLNLLLKERTRVAAAIAHDLRTPLTRLAFRLDDLPEPLGPKVRADIEEMKSMISAALDFMREHSAHTPRERLDLRLLVERVVNDQLDLGHDVTLEPGEQVTVEGVPLALRRMVSNLVENALKYGERAHLRIELNAERVILEVDDDGPGIPESLHQQVFEPFYRIEGSRNRNTGGIGLGLATVRGIVLEHGGEIRLGNRKSGGLRVSVSLPRAT